MKSAKFPLWLRFVLLVGVLGLASGAGLVAYRYYTRPVTLTVAVGSIDGEGAKAMCEDADTSHCVISTLPDGSSLAVGHEAVGSSGLLYLVTEKFAACANILPAIESIYRWKEKLETGNETLVFFKLSEDRQSEFQNKLRSLHPYEVPEIILVPVSSGLPEYLRWVVESCG